MRLPAAASWLVAALAAAALALAGVLAYADRTVFDADGFAARADAALQAPPVRAAAARRVVGAALQAEPDLVAARPLLEATVDGVVRSDAFRSLARSAVRDVHRSAFDRDARTVTLTVADVGILVAQAAERFSPGVAARIPQGLQARVTGVRGAALEVAELAERVRRGAWLALALGVLAATAVVLLSRSRRAGMLRLAAAIAVAAALVGAAAALAPRLAATGVPAADRAALRALLGAWLDPLAWMALAASAAGAVVALAAASLLRPVEPATLARRAWAMVATPPRRPAWRVVRAVAAGALGLAMVIWPTTFAAVAVVVVGALLFLAAVAELLRMATPAERAARRGRRRAPVVIAAAVLVAGAGGAAALAASDAPRARAVGACNGSQALCDRPLDRVAFVGTHNSMAADGEPGWLFAAQDAGIPAQLEDGVRALMIDTHYGFATPRGVTTALGSGSKSRGKIADAVSEHFVRTAERLRNRIGRRAEGTREVFLCHAYCEVGATRAVDALAEVHRFLVTHPEEVLILSIEDDTSAADTAKVIRDSGLIREVYHGPAGPPWPTLRELIERDERVLVLVEYDPGTEPWMHRQDELVQETPFHFDTAAALAAPDTCRPNRGDTAGSLFLVNHWVDTSPAPRPSIADEVNARGFLGRRLARCERERGMLPNIVAVDFYRRGDVFAAVAALNR
ncbi:MAG TPA: hypothetical protein VFG79_06360 [Solirubrobacter sp.]|nr:hypothetical protein [Solirubrobacter sp.]